MIVVTRSARKAVGTGWRAWLLGVVFVAVMALLFVIASVMLGVAITVGAVLFIAVPVAVGSALLASLAISVASSLRSKATTVGGD